VAPGNADDTHPAMPQDAALTPSAPAQRKDHLTPIAQHAAGRVRQPPGSSSDAGHTRLYVQTCTSAITPATGTDGHSSDGALSIRAGPTGRLAGECRSTSRSSLATYTSRSRMPHNLAPCQWVTQTVHNSNTCAKTPPCLVALQARMFPKPGSQAPPPTVLQHDTHTPYPTHHTPLAGART
jgi:hypothetical protein